MSLILFALAAQAATVSAAPTAVPAAAAEGEKLVCKRSVETGSFVRSRKVCLTRRQWRRVADDSQDLGRSMRPALTVGPTG